MDDSGPLEDAGCIFHSSSFGGPPIVSFVTAQWGGMAPFSSHSKGVKCWLDRSNRDPGCENMNICMCKYIHIYMQYVDMSYIFTPKNIPN